MLSSPIQYSNPQFQQSPGQGQGQLYNPVNPSYFPAVNNQGSFSANDPHTTVSGIKTQISNLVSSSQYQGLSANTKQTYYNEIYSELKRLRPTGLSGIASMFGLGGKHYSKLKTKKPTHKGGNLPCIKNAAPVSYGGKTKRKRKKSSKNKYNI